MSPLSSWQYPSCFRKGQIRQLLRTLTDYFYVSSSSLVSLSTRWPESYTQNSKTVCCLYPSRYFQNHLRNKKIYFHLYYFQKIVMTYFPFYNMCHRKGEWSREDKDINFFPSRIWGDFGGRCEFLSRWQCSFPCPFCQTLLRHRQGTSWVKNHSNIAAVCPCQLESMSRPDHFRDRRIFCLLPAWSLLSLSCPAGKLWPCRQASINKYTGCSLEHCTE